MTAFKIILHTREGDNGIRALRAALKIGAATSSAASTPARSKIRMM